MNLRHYFNSVNFSKYADSLTSAWKYSLGSTIEKYTLQLNELNISKVELAIVGVPFENCETECNVTGAPDKIREELYRLAGLGKVNIVDFGNLKQSKSQKGNYLAVRDLIDYLTELNITVIVIGGGQDFSYGVCQAFRNNKFFSFCSIDAFLDIRKGREPFNSTNYLSRIFSNQPNIFQFSLLAYQRHYVVKEYLAKTKGVNNHLRLGSLTVELELAEPVFRNSDFLSFDFGAIKYAEAPGKRLTPNGLSGEHACQLAKYAGLSNRLNVFGLFEIDDAVDNSELTVKLAAQVIWYFIEGRIQRSVKLPSDSEGFVTYKVEIEDINTPINFYKNLETNQWWFQVQAENSEIMYVACSEKDYIAATHNEIPGLWLKYIQKIDELLK
ncbi:MAG: arginase family protein [Bacteroidota bacterium]